MPKRKSSGRKRGVPQEDRRINLGKRPANKAEAWRALSPEAKQALFDLRQGGNTDMGGTPGQSPYWWSQDKGNPFAMIEARHFIEAAVDAWRDRREDIVEESLKG